MSAILCTLKCYISATDKLLPINSHVFCTRHIIKSRICIIAALRVVYTVPVVIRDYVRETLELWFMCSQ